MKLCGRLQLAEYRNVDLADKLGFATTAVILGK